jgi:hypothetical protein
MNEVDPMTRRTYLMTIAGLLVLSNAPVGRADEKSAADKIEKLGGKIKRDDSKSDKPVTEVDLSYSKDVKNDDLKLLKEFKQLTWVACNDTPITDDGLKHVEELKGLKTLGLVNTGVTDKGLDHLKGLKRLNGLNLTGTKVTKQGIEELQKSLPDTFIIGGS